MFFDEPIPLVPTSTSLVVLVCRSQTKRWKSPAETMFVVKFVAVLRKDTNRPLSFSAGKRQSELVGTLPLESRLTRVDVPVISSQRITPVVAVPEPVLVFAIKAMNRPSGVMLRL